MNPIIEQYKVLVDYLGKALGPNYEIVLHDLTEGSYSVVAIANGCNSNRRIGSPITQKALSFIQEGLYLTSDYQIGYPGLTHEQAETISSTMFIKDPSGNLIGLLCINYNTKQSHEIMEQVSSLLNLTRPAAAPDNSPDAARSAGLPADAAASTLPAAENAPDSHASCSVSCSCSARETPEIFSSSLEDLISDVVTGTLSPDTPVERLNQTEKMEIVRKLKENGVFSIKGAVREVAHCLHCSEPSIYRYLKSI